MYPDGRIHGVAGQWARRVHAVYSVDDPVRSTKTAACGRPGPSGGGRWRWVDREVDCPRCLQYIAKRSAKRAKMAQTAPVPKTSNRWRHVAGLVPASRMTPKQQAMEIRRLRRAVAEVRRQVDLLAVQGRLDGDEVAIILRPIREHLPAERTG